MTPETKEARRQKVLALLGRDGGQYATWSRTRIPIRWHGPGHPSRSSSPNPPWSYRHSANAGKRGAVHKYRTL